MSPPRLPFMAQCCWIRTRVLSIATPWFFHQHFYLHSSLPLGIPPEPVIRNSDAYRTRSVIRACTSSDRYSLIVSLSGAARNPTGQNLPHSGSLTIWRLPATLLPLPNCNRCQKYCTETSLTAQIQTHCCCWPLMRATTHRSPWTAHLFRMRRPRTGSIS